MRCLGLFCAALVLLASGAAFAQGQTVDPVNQVQRQAAITPTDNTALPGGTTGAIYVGSATACNLAFIAVNDTAAVTWDNVPSGAILPVRAKVVMATNTTCVNLVALYW